MTEDGSIVINTKIRTDGIKAGTAEIEAGVHRAADRVNTLGSNVKKTLNNQIDSFVKLNDEYSTQEQKVESLRQKVAAYANQRIPTTEYKEITAQIEQAQEKLNRLNDAKERLVLLLRAAVLTNEDIAAELFTCLKLGIGYDVMYKKNWIPMQRKDFQGYRRKTLETVERLLLMRDIEMEE